MFKILKSNLLKEECSLGWERAPSSERGEKGMGDGGGRLQLSGLWSPLGHSLCIPPPNPDPRALQAAPHPCLSPRPSLLHRSLKTCPSLPCTPASPCFSLQCPLSPSPPHTSAPCSGVTSFQGAHLASTSSSHPPPPVSPLPSLEHKRKMRKASVWALGGEG